MCFDFSALPIDSTCRLDAYKVSVTCNMAEACTPGISNGFLGRGSRRACTRRLRTLESISGDRPSDTLASRVPKSLSWPSRTTIIRPLPGNRLRLHRIEGHIDL